MELTYSGKQRCKLPRRHLFHLLMGIFLFFVLEPSALAKQSIAEQIREAGAWNQKADAIITETTNVVSTEDMNEIFELAEFKTEEGFEEFQNKILDWSTNVDIKLSAIKNKLEKLPEPPKVPFSKQINENFSNGKIRVADIVNRTIATVENLKTILTRVSQGDQNGITDINIVLQDFAQLTIQGGIYTTEKNLLAVKRTHPAYQFNQLILYNLEYTLAKLEIVKLDILDDSTADSRKPFVKNMKKRVSKAHKTLPRARRNLERMRKDIHKRPLQGTTNDDTMAMLDTYEHGFVVEEKILVLKGQAIKVYSSDKSSAEIVKLTDAIDAKLFKLLLERMRLQNVRTSLIANLGK